MSATVRVLLILPVMTVSFFSPLVYHPGQVLYSDHSDLLAEHIPAKRFLVRSFQETGELPLWCPWQFAGTPFVHDIQVAMFYPPHLALLLVPEDQVSFAVSWLVVLHVLLAGWAMFAYTCHRGLSPLGGAVAAVGYMFAGRWMMHLLGGGHYITIGLAWLPLVLLCLERAIRLGSVAWAVGAGTAFALLTLATQPQWTFYAGLFAAAWTLGTVLEEASFHGGTRRGLLCWAGYGALAVGLALALTAIQLLPTLEAAGQSSRAGGVGTEAILEGGVRVVLFLVGPALTVEPANLMWEDRGGLALLWLCAAVLAPVLRSGRVRYEAAVGVGLFLFAAGGAVLLQPLPGFNLFRQPARMMVIASFPVAWLAGVSAQALFPPGGLSVEQRRRCRRWMLRVGAATLLLCGGFALRQLLQGAPLRFDFYWLSAPLLFGLAFHLLGRGSRPFLRCPPAAVWVFLLGLDLLALDSSLIGVWPEPELYDVPRCVRFVAERSDDRSRVLEVNNQDGGGQAGPLWTGAAMALIGQVEAVRGYSPLDVLRYREFLQFIADRDDALGALDSTFTHPVSDNSDLKNRSLLDLLGVRYLLLPVGVDPPGVGWKEVSRQDEVTVYDFILGGWWNVGGYVVHENAAVLPRAFVVPHAEGLPEGPAVLRTLKTTDFHQTVLLEDYDPPAGAPVPAGRGGQPGTGHTVQVHCYEPNRVEMEVKGAGGFLVLTDVWYPGWTATVDGETVRAYRANYVFRAVEVSAGRHEVIFRFEPASYRRGRLMSLGTLAAVGLFGVVVLVRRLRSRFGERGT
ncbi:MAG: YfhO family protein [Planctomycetes bacterium]|nr:YfhO family protein [Planctomycetota bacterium]